MNRKDSAQNMATAATSASPLAPITNAAPIVVPTVLSLDSVRCWDKQPRRHFDEGALAALATDIAENGIMQPIVVRHDPENEGAYLIVMGERRYRAAKMAGLALIPATVRDYDDAQALERALAENEYREQLNPIERARAFRDLAAMGRDQVTIGQIAGGKSQEYVSNHLRLLRLPEGALARIEDGSLSFTAGVILLPLADEAPATCNNLAEAAVRDGWSTATLRDAVSTQVANIRRQRQPSLEVGESEDEGKQDQESGTDVSDNSDGDSEAAETTDRDAAGEGTDGAGPVDVPPTAPTETGEEKPEESAPVSDAQPGDAASDAGVADAAAPSDSDGDSVSDVVAPAPSSSSAAPASASVANDFVDSEPEEESWSISTGAEDPPIAGDGKVLPRRSPVQQFGDMLTDVIVGEAALPATICLTPNTGYPKYWQGPGDPDTGWIRVGAEGQLEIGSPAPAAAAPISVSATDPLLTPLAARVLAALVEDWNKRHTDRPMTSAERLENVLLARAEASGIDTEAIEQEVGV